MISGHVAASAPGTLHAHKPGAMLVHDRPCHVPLSKILDNGDIILLLTPVALPLDGTSGRDPFEPLGRELAKYHPWVRHVPYTARGGITSTHIAFIKRAKVVVFVISGPASPGQPSQVELSRAVQKVGDNRPHVVVACCDVHDLEPMTASFPTLLQLPGYSLQELEVGADLLFLGRSTRRPPSPERPLFQNPVVPHRWSVSEWNQARDVPAVHELWCQCMPPKFRLQQASFLRVLQRDGYAKHYVVRQPGSNDILGFCATYITYLDSTPERLVGSLAALFVRESYKAQGIGRVLHSEALKGFKRTRGVSRLQLGSTFPRLLYGLPVNHPSEEWFKRRGWQMDRTAPGTGQEVCDWLLSFDEWPTGGFPSIQVTFRPCGFADFDRVLETVERESDQNGSMGWYDQYAKLAESFAMSDIMVGWREDTIVATAITYVMHSDNPSAEDIPWAGSISNDTGGVTCICITGMSALRVWPMALCAYIVYRLSKSRLYHGQTSGRLCAVATPTREA